MKRRGLIGLSGFSPPGSATSSLGDTRDWGVWYSVPDEVYLWRAHFTGATLADALAVVRAVGLGSDLNLDVRGIAVRPDGEAAEVDVVLSTGRHRAYPPGVYDNAADIALKVAGDAALRQRFPALKIDAAQLLQLVGPPAAVDFWRAHSILWSRALGQTGQGGPTSEFAEGRGIYLGAADDGPRLKPWSIASPGLAPTDSKEKDSYTLLLVMGGLVLAWFAVRSL